MQIVSEILNGIWLIDRAKAEAFLPVVGKLITGEKFDLVDYSQERLRSRNVRSAVYKNQTFQISDYGQEQSPADATENSIALVDLRNVITKYDTYCGPAGMMTKSEILKKIDSTENILATILMIDSPGGEAYASRLLVETLQGLNKPVISFVDDLAASAAYWIASATDFIVANSNMAEVGSIGTMATIIDYRAQLEMMGIKLHEIYADASVDKNKDYYEALNGNYDQVKASLNKINEIFLSSIETTREGRLKETRELWGTGKLFHADQALEIGLIDEIDTLENTIAFIYNNLI